MAWDPTLYTFVGVAATILFFAIVAGGWQYRAEPAAKAFLALMSAMGGWVLLYAVGLGFTTLDAYRRPMADDGPAAPPADEFASVSADAPTDAPDPDDFADVFSVYDVREENGDVVYYGDALADRRSVLQATFEQFREAGYGVTFEERTGELALVASPLDENEGVPWLNVALLLATVGTTFFSGALWYYVFQRHDLAANPLGLLDALPFVLAVLGVLGTHELGHYLASRYHGVDASLPYFIPMLPPFGTWGAVIRLRGHFPDRRSLFDVGIAGPLAGLAAAIVVTAIGLLLPPVTVPPAVVNAENTLTITFGYPPLFHAVAWAVGQPLTYPEGTVANPVIMGGWIGMLVTFLNMLPVGQLDGGHVSRAVLGPRQERLAAVVPLAPLAVAGYVYLTTSSTDSVGIWLVWTLLAAVMARMGSATPVAEGGLGWPRVALAAVTFVLGLLCFTPVPIAVTGG